MSEYNRQNLVYEKEDLLIDGTGKYPDYNFYRVAGVAIGGKDKGEAEHEAAAGRRAEPAALRTTMDHRPSIAAAVVAIVATALVITRLNACMRCSI